MANLQQPKAPRQTTARHFASTASGRASSPKPSSKSLGKADQPLINAADAARRAAHSTDAARGSLYRRAAAGVSAERGRKLDARASSKPRRGMLGTCIVIGFLLAACVIYLGARAVTGVLLFDDRAASDPATDIASDAAASAADGSDAVSTDGTITCLGMDYLLEEEADGAWAFCDMQPGATGASRALFTLTGDAAGFALYDNVFYVVSNKDGSYYVQSFLPGDGSLPADYHAGTGTVTALSIDGSSLELALDEGEPVTLDLAS